MTMLDPTQAPIGVVLSSPTLPESTPPVENRTVVLPAAAPTVDITNPQVLAFVEKARQEEKRKLYEDLEAKDKELRDLRAKLALKQDPAERVAEQALELQALQDKVNTLTATLEADRQAAATRERSLQLQAYLEKRLREESSAGSRLVHALVGGQSEQEIDNSISLAKAEYAAIQAELASTVAVAPTPQAPVGTVVTASPSSFPSVPAAPMQTPEQGPSNSDIQAEIAYLTSPEAVRSGLYAKNREYLQSLLHRSGNVAPKPGQSFAQYPRQYATPERTTLNGNVAQPSGLPLTPVRPVALQTQPSVPLPVASTVNTYVQPQPQPSELSPRDLAVQSATHALSMSADRAAAVAGVRAPASREYSGAAPSAVDSHSFTGVSPMIRNT